MKKILTTLSLIAIILILPGCANKTYTEITYDELSTLIENKEDFVLFIGSETCSACTAYKVTVNKIVENYGIDIKYIDISSLSEDEETELLSNFYFTATPTTVFVKNGKEEDTSTRIEGNEKYSEVVEQLTNQGYIEE